MTEEMKERIIKRLQLKPKELINADNIGGDKSGLWGNGKGVWGIAEKGLKGDITNIWGCISGIGPGDISRFVGCVDGIEGSVDEIIEVLEKAKKVIKQWV